MTGKEPKVAAQSLKINGTFAKQLKALREDKGLSQSVMARELNIPPATYANWEQGRALPSLGQIPFLAEFFNLLPLFVRTDLNDFLVCAGRTGGDGIM